MNQDLQAKLQKRRQMADGDIEPEISIDDLQQSRPTITNTADSLHMSADLKAVMERQRKKADGVADSSTSSSHNKIAAGKQQSQSAALAPLPPLPSTGSPSPGKKHQKQSEIPSGSSRTRSSRSSKRSSSTSKDHTKEEDHSHSESHSQYSADDKHQPTKLSSSSSTTGSRKAPIRRKKSLHNRRPSASEDDVKSVTSHASNVDDEKELNRSASEHPADSKSKRRHGRKPGSIQLSSHETTSKRGKSGEREQKRRGSDSSASSSSSSSSPSSSDSAGDDGSRRRDEKLFSGSKKQKQRERRRNNSSASIGTSASRRQADQEHTNPVSSKFASARETSGGRRRGALEKRHSSRSLEDSPSSPSVAARGSRRPTEAKLSTSIRSKEGDGALSNVKEKGIGSLSGSSKHEAHDSEGHTHADIPDVTNVDSLDVETLTFGASDAFGSDFASFPSSDAAAIGTSDTKATFFGAFDDASFPTAPTELANAASVPEFGTTDPFFGASAFQGDMFLPPAEKIQEPAWDTTPMTDVPAEPDGTIILNATTSFVMPFLGHPVTNPLNGNIIFFSMTKNGPFIHEVNPHLDFMQIMAAPVISSDLQRRLATKYHVSACGLDSVISLSAGLHHINGQVRVRVAAVLALRILEAKQALTIVAVWQWGYASPHPIGLQFVFAPPSGAEFAADPYTLKNADGLLFMAGNSPKGPCIFISKPTLRESWSVNYLNVSGAITNISVTATEQRHCPYLAIAMSDSSVAVWTYIAALGGTQAKGNEPSKRWLFPLCRLDAMESLKEAVIASIVLDNDGSVARSNDPGYCTHLAWLPPQPSMGAFLLLAATYQNGLTIFHVERPLVACKESKGEFAPLAEPNEETELDQVPSITPICVTRWNGDWIRSCACWVDLGPHMSPSLGVLMHTTHNHDRPAQVILGAMRLSQYRKGPPSKERLIAFDLLGSRTFLDETALYPHGIMHIHGGSSVLCYSDKSLIAISMGRMHVKLDTAIRRMGQPITSCPPGLGSTGESLLNDAGADNEGILHIFTVLQCERRRSAVSPDMQLWSRPRRRLWLCKTMVGDSNSAGAFEEEKKESGFGDDPVIKGGASSDAICELFDEQLEGLIPVRIVRCKGYALCAVAFRPSMCSKNGPARISLETCAIAIVDYSSPNGSMHVVDGRDIAFIPTESAGRPRGVILSKDGSCLTSFVWDLDKRACELGTSFRPIVGVDTGTNYVSCLRVLAFSGESSVGLLVIGSRLHDNRCCIVAGDLCPAEDISLDGWSQLLPNIVSGRCLWLNQFEDVYSIVGLEADGDGYRNFGLSTAFRVMVVSSGMEISAETNADVPICGLAPLGAFALAFCAGNKIRTLSCLDGNLAIGTLATLPLPKTGYSDTALLAVRPDRLIVGMRHKGIRAVELNQNANIFLLPAPTSRPALLLEAMVANAICVGGKSNMSTAILRLVIEKFGRKVGSITHGDNEGIGNLGAGLTPRTFEMLNRYGLTQAASWLLTGTTHFDRTANSKILPPWLPLAPKAKACSSSDAFLHIIASGDPYFADYVKDPDQKMPSVLPRQSDSASYASREKALDFLRCGDAAAAVKSLDLAGSESCDSLMLQMALALGKKEPVESSKLLETLSGFSARGIQSSDAAIKAPSSLAALALSLKGQGMDSEKVARYMKPLAPSLQRGARPTTRSRQTLFGNSETIGLLKQTTEKNDTIWTAPCNESKHVWNEGPRKEKSHLLSLMSIEDWLGRRRPAILGKEGASAARDRGEQTLADILNKGDEDSFGGSDIDSVQDGWADGVGEGRTDEANLSAYFRFSEGEDEDSLWPTDGFVDLSPFKNKALVIGDPQAVTVQPTTSNVDEGDSGKVKSLFDVVFEKSGHDIASGLAIAAPRGCSLDVGVLHLADKSMRQKCTVEFWYYLPSLENIPVEIVLARRTYGSSGDDMSNICLTSIKSSVLWELVLLPSKELEFRTSNGGSMLSSSNYLSAEEGDDSDDEPQRNDLVNVGRWNHVTLVLTSKDPACMSKCSVSLYMRGEEVASTDLSMTPSSVDDDDLDSSTLTDLFRKSYMVFGLNHVAGFRMTELRVWACARSSVDTQALMYEYLTAAETKKKFKVKISSNKNISGGAKIDKGTFLAPPKGGVSAMGPSRGMLGLPKGGAPRGLLAPKAGATPDQTKDTSGMFSLAPPPKKKDQSLSMAPPKLGTEGASNISESQSITAPADTLDPLDVKNDGPEIDDDDEADEEILTSLWDTAIPFSQKIKPSAASALIRGPPATRHFGGNRGGLADHSGMERSGVGGIAICGSEKTIVWRDTEDPPSRTHPIGASGAIISDLMDENGREYLCCFMAKEKHMTVFELQSKTVVVELQMTTKLNFWRFLPPEAAGNTLCFMLITPVGGFHWMPLEESPRPHQVWKRGSELHGKKVVNYEEGGSNGLGATEIISRVGLVMVTRASGNGALEAWIVPIEGDSRACQVSDDVMGACFCQPPNVENGPFLPLLVTVHQLDDGIYVNLVSVKETRPGSVELGVVEMTRIIDETGFESIEYDPPAMAMGSFPEAILCSMGSIIVVIIRRKGLIAAFELEDGDLTLIALESVDHYVIDAIMRYSGDVGGAEIVMILSDEENPKDGRMVSFCFRSTA